MSKRKNYTIETVQSSSAEWGVSQAPFSLAPQSGRFRKSCVPYIAGIRTATDDDLRSSECWLPAPKGITLLRISSDSQIFVPNLDYNQELTLAHITASSQIYEPDLDFVQELALNHISSTSQIYDPNLDSDLSLTLEHISSTTQIYEPDVHGPPQEVTLSHIISSSAVHTPGISASYVAELLHIISTSQVYSPGVVYGHELTFPHIDSVSQVYSPELIYSQELLISHIDSTSQVYTPNVDYNQQVTLNHISSISQTYTPNIDYNHEITLGHIASISQIYTPVLTAGHTVIFEHIDSVSQVYTPNIDYNQEVTFDYIASTSQIYIPRVNLGQEATLEHINSTSQVYTPNIDYGQEIILEHIASTSQIYTPIVSLGQEVILEHINSTSQVYTPNIDYNHEITFGYIASTSQTYTPDIDSDQEATLGHISSTSQTYTPDIDYNQESTLGFISSTSQIYTPGLGVVQEVTLNHITSQFANNKSIAFNGVNGQSQLTVPDSDSLSFGADGTIGNEPSFTWSAWIKPTTLGFSPFGIVSKIATGGSGDEYFFGYVPLVGLVLLIADGAGFTDDYIAQTNVTLTAGVWQHVCATYDGSRVPGGIKLYLNGVEKSSIGLTPGSYTAMSNSSADVVIGRRWSGLTTNVSDGFIDEVAAFDKELSSAEVSELYNSAEALNLNTFSAASDLVSWWRMGDTTVGTSPDYTIPDAIGSNNGTMSSFQGDSTSGVVIDAVPAPSQAYTPNLDYDHALTLGFISSTSQVYTPNIDYNQEVTLSHIASTSQTYAPNIDYNQSVTLSLIDSTITLYNPTISVASEAGVYYTQIVSASNPNNSASMHIGSLYLDARTYSTIGVLISEVYNGVGGSDAHAELKRFTGGSSLLTLSNTSTSGPTWSYITSSNVVVSDSDWYDIYISASGNPATASIRGVYYEI